MSEFRSDGGMTDGREGWTNGDGCTFLMLEPSIGTTEVPMRGHKPVYAVMRSHKNDTGAVKVTSLD